MTKRSHWISPAVAVLGMLALLERGHRFPAAALAGGCQLQVLP